MEKKQITFTREYHPAYGLTDEYRKRALAHAAETSTKEAAEKFNVSPRTISRWMENVDARQD